MKTGYRVLTGFNFSKDGVGKGHRFEQGRIFEEFPDGVDVKGLLEIEAIEKVPLDKDGKLIKEKDSDKKKESKPEPEPKPEPVPEPQPEDDPKGEEEIQTISDTTGTVESEIEELHSNVHILTDKEASEIPAPPESEEVND